MNNNIIEEIEKTLKISKKSIEAVLSLLKEGNTIPFIARYRKERTNNLDEEQIRKISEYYEYEVNLLKRKEDVIRLIDEKGMLTEELKKEILNSSKLVEVEDLYRPFKEKKKTKATEAIKNGLEPFAKHIMQFKNNSNLDEESKKYFNDVIKTKKDAILNAQYIIAENISDNADYRKWIRGYIFNLGVLTTKKKKKAIDENETYKMYYDYSENVKNIKSHRVLAINRAEKEKVIGVNIEIDESKVWEYLENKIIKNKNSDVVEIVKEAIKDSYKRLIKPSIEREIRSEVTLKAEEDAINIFGKNLESLLLQPPMKEKVVLGLDPAFRTGCKLAVLDKTGSVKEIAVIYPHEPRNDFENSKKKILELIDKHSVEVIAIGNGTASRESESFVGKCLKERKNVKYVIVNEAGASVYSASKLAIKEFPKLHVEERSAISIARRLQDPLAELVKIDPESIGVGQYQHDVNNKRLKETLDFVVSKVVNNVGVNLNTASFSLLSYVSGLTKKAIDNIIGYRERNGKILDRKELLDLKGMGEKTFNQAAGFLRILDGKNSLDSTAIHPESYSKAMGILKELNVSLKDLGTSKIKNELETKKNLLKTKEIDKYTFEDIIESLEKPSRDPRDEIEAPLLKSDVLKIEDLTINMKLQGTVRNVVDFGAFVDIGLKNDGLVHISKITNKFIKHPMEVLAIGDIVDCYVIKIDGKKVSLSLIEPQ